MSEEIAIKVENLSKIYKLYNSNLDRLKESLHPLRRQYHRDFYALKNINFEVKKGESVGIIGKNGSGKSTLLKILTGVLTPSSGESVVNGKISALLELGAGFNQELTGIENVYFNGMLMGFTREEMDERLDDILSFANIGEFVYQRVKTYSSGMFVRLAFAVAVNVDPEILIIDEALSVGDAVFQSKCFTKIQELMSKATVIFVTHDMTTLQSICDKVYVINDGEIYYSGSAANATLEYYKLCREFCTQPTNEYKHNDANSVNTNSDNTLVTDAAITSLVFSDSFGETTDELESGKSFCAKLVIKVNADIQHLAVGVLFRNVQGMRLFGLHSYHQCQYDFGERKKGELIHVEFKSIMLLSPGEYLVSAGIAEQITDFDYRNLYISDSFSSVKIYGNANSYGVLVNQNVEIQVS